MTVKEGENRFGKGELVEEYKFFIIFPPQPPSNPSIGDFTIAFLFKPLKSGVIVKIFNSWTPDKID
ncbi:hypothetical protein [Methanosarcina sp. 2.H.A.1B.4]|uniref:hypothetical protein n=1 Tax=Methanosarcina sp. 2.H.A.1B.4 TaxID=1483600 RepID=UPI0006224BE9|nr:hypothetical protein [Methanosarcina sp. 2.H.A.1B.4]KKG11669.1 hypothetical protein EO92_12030 [Methanosarcina sp. 2.H.A.1B.4]